MVFGDLRRWTRTEVQIAFDRQTQAASQTADFIERESPPFRKRADDKAVADATFRVVFSDEPG